MYSCARQNACSGPDHGLCVGNDSCRCSSLFVGLSCNISCASVTLPTDTVVASTDDSPVGEYKENAIDGRADTKWLALLLECVPTQARRTGSLRFRAG